MSDTSRPTYRQLAKELADDGKLFRELYALVNGLKGRMRFRILRRADRVEHISAQALSNGDGRSSE